MTPKDEEFSQDDAYAESLIPTRAAVGTDDRRKLRPKPGWGDKQQYRMRLQEGGSGWAYGIESSMLNFAGHACKEQSRAARK